MFPSQYFFNCNIQILTCVISSGNFLISVVIPLIYRFYTQGHLKLYCLISKYLGVLWLFLKIVFLFNSMIHKIYCSYFISIYLYFIYVGMCA